MVLGTAGLPMGRLELESIVRAPLVVIADPVVAASGPPATVEELEACIGRRSSAQAGSPPKPPVSVGWGGRGAALLDRPAGTILAFANPTSAHGLFVWAGRSFLAVVADPAHDVALDAVGELTVSSGRLVAGSPDAIAAWGPEADTADGSAVRARMHRGRQRLGLIVIAHASAGLAVVTAGEGAVAVSFPLTTPTQLRLAS